MRVFVQLFDEKLEGMVQIAAGTVDDNGLNGNWTAYIIMGLYI